MNNHDKTLQDYFEQTLEKQTLEALGVSVDITYQAVINKVHDRIGVHFGDFAIYHAVENQLFDLKGLRIPLAAVSFIPITPINAVRLNNRTLHIVDKNCKHITVEAFDGIAAHPDVVKFSTSRPCRNTIEFNGYTTNHICPEPITKLLESL